MYRFLAVLGLCCCMGFSPVVASRGYSLVVMHRFPIAVFLLLKSTGSRDVVHGLSCSAACGIFLLPGLNSYFLPW